MIKINVFKMIMESTICTNMSIIEINIVKHDYKVIICIRKL